MYQVPQPIRKDRRSIDVDVAFPQQHQDRMPGLESEMNPQPISEDQQYKPSGKLQSKAAIITGGDSGIGRAVAIAFAKEGADIAIIYYNEDDDARQTRSRIEQLGRRCFALKADLKTEQAAKAAVEQAVQSLGKLDVLVNNCAVQYLQNSLTDITEEQLNVTFASNIFSYFHVTKAALAYLQSGSCIINTTSVTAYAGNPALIDYSATKGAVTAFTRSLALSLAEKQIRVNAVAPGPVWTPLIPASFPAAEVETFGTAPSPPPMGRAAQPFEMAGCYVFLASDDSGFMSGQVLHPNGGQIVNG